MANSIKVQAELLRRELASGNASMKEIIEWADALIGCLDKPDPLLLEISISLEKPPGFVDALLARLPGDFTENDVSRYCIEKLRIAYESDPTLGEEIALKLYNMAIKRQLPPNVFGIDAYSLHDSFMLANQRIIANDEAHHNLKKYLNKYGEVVEA